MIQTEEEAAHTTAAKKYQLLSEPYDILKNGFVNGAAWQREQGIDWISVKDGLPQPTEISSIADYSADVLTYYSGRLEFSKAAFLKNGEFIGFCGQAGFAPTHWAYINLPKTDK